MTRKNPERIMLVLFPLITLTLFAVAAVLLWVITSDPFNILP